MCALPWNIFNMYIIVKSVLLFCYVSCRCRISRILEATRGYALLIGVGGSGKQSLSKLAAYIGSLEVFQITLKNGYGIQDLKARRLIYMTAVTIIRYFK